MLAGVKVSDLCFISEYAWLAELLYLVRAGARLPLREVLMLSSRWSGKSHQVVLFLILCAVCGKAVVVYVVRARNKNTMEEFENVYGLLCSLFGDDKLIVANRTMGTIKVLKSKFVFDTLNEEKEKVNKSGGKIGKQIEHQAEYIFTFYEECSQLDEQLVENHRQSIKGNMNTQMMFFYASNPWRRDHWFVVKFLAYLPESKKNENELLTKGYNAFFDARTKSFYFRPRHTINKFVPKDVSAELDNVKNYNYNKWRIVSLGFTGNLNGAIYQAALEKLDTKPQLHPLTHSYFGGVDWGDGKTAGGSPTVALFGGVSYESGIDIYGEFTHHNAKGRVLTTQQQQELVCDFFIEWYKKVNRNIIVYVDNAALGDFYQMFNVILRQKGYNNGEIEFFPAFKPKNTWERVETVNNLMTLGILRYDPKVCKRLYESMENCYELEKDNPKENTKRERSHEWTHALHALEYLIGRNLKEFQQQIPEALQTSKSLDKWGIF